MQTIPTFKKTNKQKLAIKLLKSQAKYIMAYGGSRSGKTFILIYALIVRASKVKSRHCILRLKFNAVKKSVWLDTLPKLLNLCFPGLPIKFNNQDYYATLPNGSEIWIGGLDNEKQMEKILGNEYSTLFFNECSQIPYAAVEMGLTRLAEKNKLVNKAYFDENPPVKRHWSYQLFIRQINPKTGLQINKERYACLLMNPEDNKENIDEGYFEILEGLSPDERARFEFGEFADGHDGQAYYAFNQEKHTRDLSKEFSEHLKRHGKPFLYLGMDFNVSPMTAVIAYVVNNVIYIYDELYQLNSDTFQACKELKQKGYYGTVFPDSTGGNRSTTGTTNFDILKNEGFSLQYTHNPYQLDRVNNVNRLFAQDRIIINNSCVKLINDLEKVSWLGAKLDQKTDSMLTHVSDSLGYLAWGLFPLTSFTKAKINFK